MQKKKWACEHAGRQATFEERNDYINANINLLLLFLGAHNCVVLQ